MNDIENIILQKEIPDTISFIDSIFDSALKENVSDIHIETTKDFLLIRFRKDGDFVIKNKISSENIATIVTRLKVLSKVKIDENKKPQD
jgi:protein transport protein HofB